MTTLGYNNMTMPGGVTPSVPLGYDSGLASGLTSWNNTAAYPMAGAAAPATGTVSSMGSASSAAFPVSGAPAAAAGGGLDAATVMKNIIRNGDFSQGGGVGGFLKNTFMNEGGGLNLDNLAGLASGIGSLGAAWSGFQANRIARESLGFQKEAYNTNLSNQLQSYNTALSDKATAVAAQKGWSQKETDDYIAKNRMGS